MPINTTNHSMIQCHLMSIRWQGKVNIKHKRVIPYTIAWLCWHYSCRLPNLLIPPQYHHISHFSILCQMQAGETFPLVILLICLIFNHIHPCRAQRLMDLWREETFTASSTWKEGERLICHVLRATGREPRWRRQFSMGPLRGWHSDHREAHRNREFWKKSETRQQNGKVGRMTCILRRCWGWYWVACLSQQRYRWRYGRRLSRRGRAGEEATEAL